MILFVASTADLSHYSLPARLEEVVRVSMAMSWHCLGDHGLLVLLSTLTSAQLSTARNFLLACLMVAFTGAQPQPGGASGGCAEPGKHPELVAANPELTCPSVSPSSSPGCS